MLKYLGAATVLVIAFFVSNEYTRYSKRRLSESEAVLSFIRAVRREVACFLRPICEWAQEYNDSVLEDAGLLPALRRGEQMREAYNATRGKLLIGKEADRVFAAFCSSFGRAYRDDELRAIDTYIEQLEAEVITERSGIQRGCRLVSTLCASASLAIVILLI